jgi:hypothetical protein
VLYITPAAAVLGLSVRIALGDVQTASECEMVRPFGFFAACENPVIWGRWSAVSPDHFAIDSSLFGAELDLGV